MVVAIALLIGLRTVPPPVFAVPEIDGQVIGNTISDPVWITPDDFCVVIDVCVVLEGLGIDAFELFSELTGTLSPTTLGGEAQYWSPNALQPYINDLAQIAEDLLDSMPFIDLPTL